MGACYVRHGFEQCSESDLRRMVNAECRQAGYEYGHSYSGNWGEKIDSGLKVRSDLSFSSLDEANDWLMDNCEKWGSLIAVKFYSVKPSAKVDAIKIKINEINNRINYFDRYINSHSQDSIHAEIAKRASRGKRKLISCPSCDSKIAAVHITMNVCPVCRQENWLTTKTDLKRIEATRQKIKKLEGDCAALNDKIDTINKKANKAEGANWQWLVGAWCSS